MDLRLIYSRHTSLRLYSRIESLKCKFYIEIQNLGCQGFLHRLYVYNKSVLDPHSKSNIEMASVEASCIAYIKQPISALVPLPGQICRGHAIFQRQTFRSDGMPAPCVRSSSSSGRRPRILTSTGWSGCSFPCGIAPQLIYPCRAGVGI